MGFVISSVARTDDYSRGILVRSLYRFGGHGCGVSCQLVFKSERKPCLTFLDYSRICDATDALSIYCASVLEIPEDPVLVFL